MDGDLEREFETRLVESSTLAFRVAYGVLRNRADAEDIAQEAFARAYRRFAQSRNRERFRAGGGLAAASRNDAQPVSATDGSI